MSVKKTIDIEVTLDNGDKVIKQFEDLGNGVLKLADSSDKLEASFEEVYNGMQPLTTRMGEAEDRLYELALAGDTTSKEYQELLTKVGQYRKVQIQTDLAVDQAATTMSQKLGTALTGATSGFAAVQGVMALTGGESEALEKSLLKVQGAMAFQQGVQGVIDYSKSVGLAGKATKLWSIAVGGTTGAMKLLRLAIISTGIGALVVLLGEVIANQDEVSKGAKDVVKATDEMSFGMRLLLAPMVAVVEAYKALRKAGEFLGLVETEEAIARKKRHEERLKQEEEYRNALVETAEQERRNANTARDANISLENLLKKQGKEQEARARKRKRLNQELTEAIYNFNSTMADQIRMELIDLDNEEAQIIKDRLDRYKDYARQIEDLENQLMEEGLEKQLELNRDRFRREREDITATGNQRLELIKLFNALEKKEEDRINEEFRQKRLNDFTSEIETLELAEDAKTEVVLKGVEKRADGEKKISKELADYRVMVANQSLTAISDIAELFSKGSEKQAKRAFNVQKAVGIAQATINTAQAITKVFAETTDFTPTQSLRIANAVAIGVAGASQVAAIASQTFEGGGGGETPSVDASGGAAQAPSFNVVGDSGINQLAQLQQAPVQAFVVSGEVTTSQALDRNRVENATL